LNALFRRGKQRAYARRRPPRLPSRPPASPPLRGILLSVLVTPYRFSSSGKYQVREAEQFCGRSSQRNRGTVKNEATRIFDGATRALAAAKTCGQLSAAYDKKDKNGLIGRSVTKEYCLKAATAKKQYANAKAENHKPLFDRLNLDGRMSMNSMAQVLNKEEIQRLAVEANGNLPR